MPSLEEADVYRTLQACLELRQSYVFREADTPWEEKVISDPSTPKPNPNPFDYTPEGKSDVSLYFNYLFSVLSWILGYNLTRLISHD